MTQLRPTTAPLALPDPRILKLSIDGLRVLGMDAVQAADSGHPGTPMALAPAGYLLWRHHLRHNPVNPFWVDRDRFVLSAGHASMLVYGLLHLTGYDVSMDQIRRFRQWESGTAGHPEYRETPGVETTTGPLGQGIANTVGMALGERWLAHRFNRQGHAIVDHNTYAFCSDGDLMEGISHEAAAIAGHQKLGKLVWIFDDNAITIEGSTDLASSTDQLTRFDGYGWHVQRVDDGNDVAALDEALRAARAETGRPSFIALRTTIGWGSPAKAGTADAHGSPLGEEEIRRTKEAIGYPSQEAFWIADEAREEWALARPRGEALETEWREAMDAYRAEYPNLADQFDRFVRGDRSDEWRDAVRAVVLPTDPAQTRAVSGKVLQGLASAIPNLVGGSADLAGSNKTEIRGEDSLLAETPAGRNVHFGVREHAMGGILNGMALHGGLEVYGGTFLIFSDYMRPAIRLASLMKLPVRYIFTHDSIGLGEDGPTHQPVEQLLSLRAIPGLMDLRPADAAETAAAWTLAMERTDGPSFLSLTRQSVPQLDRSRTPDTDAVRRGGYVFREAGSGNTDGTGDSAGLDSESEAPRVILIGSGSELQLAVEAADRLESKGIPTRVVSLMSWYLFGRQDRAYRDAVLPPDVTTRVSVEAGITLGWDRWIGPAGAAIGIDRFGASAPYERLYEEFGVTVDAVVERALAVHGAAGSG